MSHQFWRLAKRGGESLGPSCGEDGLFLGGTALIERQNDGRYAVRPQDELERLLGRAYEAKIDVDELMPGLAAIAKALSKGDLCLARIAAVHLRLPDVPDLVGRLGMEAEDLLIKLGLPATPLIRGDWDPEEHPRDGDGPNPGWFAPKDGGGAGDASPNVTPTSVAHDDDDDDWVSLPPADRIDELGHFVEWIANATPEDEPKIRAEIKRYFYDVGDTVGGDALNRALSDALEPGTTKAERQEILDELDQYTRNDPADAGAVHSGVADLLVLGPSRAFVEGGEPRTIGPPPSTGESEGLGDQAPEHAQNATAPSARSPAWSWGWGTKGDFFSDKMGANLPRYYPTIDNFADGVVTSNKSIDLTAASYQNPGRLAWYLNRYVDQVEAFAGSDCCGREITLADIKGRALNLAIPLGAATKEQLAVIDAVKARASTLGVTVRVWEF